jgi:ABC-type uncharacterized transport system substrate-binding protein
LIDRRTVLGTLALGTLALSGVATAQPSRAIARIGILRLDPTSDMAGGQPRVVQVNALLRGLQELGYRYGEDFVTEPRGAAGRPQLVASLAADLVRARLDVIVAAGPALAALKQATSTIPVVMGGASDPVGEEHARRIADLVARNRLAAVYPLRPYVQDGGLMSYGPDVNDIWRRAAGFVDKIVRGARPAELPVEQPTKFELVINLKAAKSIGLTIPAALSLRADDLVR